MYYFGCLHDLGHFLFDANGHRMPESAVPKDFPLCVHALDGWLLPPLMPEDEGRIAIWRTKGWVIIAFWDRSIDSRNKANSAFVMRCSGHPADGEIIQAAVNAFPSVFSRFEFPITRPDGKQHLMRSSLTNSVTNH